MKKILSLILGLMWAVPVWGACYDYTSATGTVSQAGTPTPDNPIEPVFYQQGNMILRAVGDYKDTFDATTGKITRRVGVKVLDGTEGLNRSTAYTGSVYTSNTVNDAASDLMVMSTHFKGGAGTTNYTVGDCIINNNYISFWLNNSNNDNRDIVKAFFAQQYANGTPVIVYYPLAEPVVEDWDGGATYCETPIKIATTKYNETKFSPLNTALANAISVVDTVVSNTITQAASIATLQAQKQTRPADDTCPAYKQCLLVEDEQGVPHWYEITDPFRDFVTPIIANNVNAASSTSTQGYTQLEYIESTGTQWIDTGVTPAQITKIDSKAQFLRTDARQALLGVSNNGSGPWNNFVGINPTSSTSKFRIQWATATVPEERWNILTDTNLHTFVFDKNALTFTVDNAVNTFADYTIENATGNMYVFGMNNGTQGVDRLVYAKMYYMKLYNGSTLVRDFVPVVENTTGKIGMYDTVGGRFYGNAATLGDDFTAGPIVENDADVPGATWTATWAANATTGVSAGTITGIARCNNHPSTAGSVITNTTSATFSTLGSICHCKMTSIDLEGFVFETDTAKWVQVDHANGGTAVCLRQCSGWCRGFTTMTERNKPVLSSVL